MVDLYLSTFMHLLIKDSKNVCIAVVTGYWGLGTNKLHIFIRL